MQTVNRAVVLFFGKHRNFGKAIIFSTLILPVEVNGRLYSLLYTLPITRLKEALLFMQKRDLKDNHVTV